MQPTDIAISRQQAACVITWSDGSSSNMSLVALRQECPCALCNEQRSASSSLMVLNGPPPSAELAGVELVGGYAVRFRWADGHDTGIYSYDYLRRLASVS